MESVIKNVWEVTIVNNETECANRIVCVVVSGRLVDVFFLYNEVSRLP